jgi:TetR/AcrR family transcriptional repressor of mexJK operon
VTRILTDAAAHARVTAGTKSRRKAQAARRREQLLAVGLALFSERGYRGTAVRDITRAAGVTEAVLYHYFANKADLWAAVLATYAPFSRVSQILEEAAAAPLDEALRKLGDELLRLLQVRRHLVLTLLSEAPTEPEVAAVLGRFLQEVGDELAAFLADRQARGGIDSGADVKAAARAFQGALLVHFLTTSLVPPSADAESEREMVDALVASLVRGLAPR